MTFFFEVNFKDVALNEYQMKITGTIITVFFVK